MRFQGWLLEALVLSVAAVWLCFSKPTDKRSQLLPPSLNPEHYELSLAPRLDRGVFHGIVVITGVATQDTDRIILHCRNLVFNTTTVTDLTADEELEVENMEEDLLLQQCHILLNQTLQVDHEYRVSLEFMGIIGKEGVGLYRDFYWESGVRHDILMTHFQPNYARTMFPCWDEPHYKAQFLLRVTALPQFPATISNMPVASGLTQKEDSQNQTWVEFEETPPMSSYLLVLVMCDYLALADSASNTSVWAPRSRLHEAQLALNVSVAVLEQCERYFGTQYALPKLDHIPVPSLNTVAMENWGAITYKRDFLLWEEGVSTSAQREMISHVICHEIVHQWLGNLVTTSWWNTTWLNEGVTSFYHYYIMDKVEPSWNVMDTMFVTQIQVILNEESVKDTKPLTNNEPLSQDTISSLAFSASTYLKGAAIIRMVFNLMTPDVFREAMVQYIVDNEYGAVDEDDLWQSLAAVADLPVDLSSVMYSWTHQPGYPLVTVLRDAHGCISVKQEKYLSRDEEDVRWSIPLTFTTSVDPDFNYPNTSWFMEDEPEMELGICLEPSDWILLNLRHAGFYRVNYDALTWQALIHDLLHCDLSDIHPVSRAQLLHDGFDMAHYGLLGYPVILDLSRYLVRETEYLPWAAASQWLDFLRAQLYHTDMFLDYQQYAVSLVDRVFSETSLRGNAGGLLQELHRKQVVELACSLAHPRCVKEATDTVYLLMSGVEVRVPLDLQPVLLCAAVRHGQDEVWHFVLKKYLSTSEQQRWKYLLPLACTSNPGTFERLLKDMASPVSWLKSTEERLNLLMEMGKQDGALEPILDMVINKFPVLATTFDLEVILHILKSFITPSLTIQETKKINNLAAVVGKTQNTKQIELMEMMASDANRPGLRLLEGESVRQWFRREVQEKEETVSTPLPPSPSSDSEATPEEEEDPETTDEGQEEDSEEEVNEDDSGEVTKEPSSSHHVGNDAVLSVLVFVLISIMR